MSGGREGITHALNCWGLSWLLCYAARRDRKQLPGNKPVLCYVSLARCIVHSLPPIWLGRLQGHINLTSSRALNLQRGKCNCWDSYLCGPSGLWMEPLHQAVDTCSSVGQAPAQRPAVYTQYEAAIGQRAAVPVRQNDKARVTAEAAPDGPSGSLILTSPNTDFFSRHGRMTLAHLGPVWQISSSSFFSSRS
jgi:hypothetical protein